MAGAKFSLEEDEEWKKPTFIYGGPFIKVNKPSVFIDTSTPINLPLQGTFKKSFAYFSLKDRLPVILTKIIDRCSREMSAIRNETRASDTDIQNFIGYIGKLKNDLLTNKNYDTFQVNTPEAKKWNYYVENTDIPNYFLNTWLFTECYVYRRIREGCELYHLSSFDPFGAQKRAQVSNCTEALCAVADKLTTMVQEESARDKKKADFITLVKLCLWSNKCDLSLSMGNPVTVGSGENVDPFKMITDWKDKLLIDDSGKAYEAIEKKKDAMLKAIEKDATAPFKQKCSCHRMAHTFGVPIRREDGAPDEPWVPEVKGKGKGKGKAKEPEKPPPEPPKDGEEPGEPKEEEPPVPCTQKIVVPKFVFFDIVCDNCGYELFTDICLGYFLIKQNLVQKVRFHLKKIPWFVSDATPEDFRYLVNCCKGTKFSKTITDPAPPGTEEEEPITREINAEVLNTIGQEWEQMIEDGTFILLADDFWTFPVSYKDMKKENYWLYRTLQFGITCVFKGDLNYRKLLADKNCNPYATFESSLQGFTPAPVMAIRTVKSELICALPKGKFDVLNKLDEKWMEKGDFGLISFCGKAEPLKPADRPCPFYGAECRSIVCPAPHDNFNLGDKKPPAPPAPPAPPQ